MRFIETPLSGAFVIEFDRIEDDRGYFGRAYCAREFEEHGLDPTIAQVNLSGNFAKGTIRGLHYQAPPHSEVKVMRCINGAIWDLIVDMRPESPTYLKHFGIELSSENQKALYVPEQFAHAYLALTDGAQAFYSASAFYTPGAEGGLRYDDPALGIDWPIPVEIVSEKDASWPLLG